MRLSRKNIAHNTILQNSFKKCFKEKKVVNTIGDKHLAGQGFFIFFFM